MTADAVKVRENRLRRMAARQGLVLAKSRRRDPHACDFGTYRLVPPTGKAATPWGGVLPSLAEVEEWLTRTSRTCGHCGRDARGFARDQHGNRLCHADEGPDCYRRVTVCREPLGILAALQVLPEGVSGIRRCP